MVNEQNFLPLARQAIFSSLGIPGGEAETEGPVDLISADGRHMTAGARLPLMTRWRRHLRICGSTAYDPWRAPLADLTNDRFCPILLKKTLAE